MYLLFSPIKVLITLLAKSHEPPCQCRVSGHRLEASQLAISSWKKTSSGFRGSGLLLWVRAWGISKQTIGNLREKYFNPL